VAGFASDEDTSADAQAGQWDEQGTEQHGHTSAATIFTIRFPSRTVNER
jgi:hypothetical protein